MKKKTRLLIASLAMAATSPSFTPLTDLGRGTYRSFPGGLYPGGSTNRPPPISRSERHEPG